MPKLLRITTALISLDKLLEGQMRAAIDAGFDVIMVSSDGSGRDELMAREQCPHIPLAMKRGLSPLSDLASLTRLVGLLRRHRPQIVHTHTPKAGLLGMLASWLCRVPVRLHTFGGLRLETMRGWRRSLMLATERLTTRCATRVFCNSCALAKRLAELNICQAEVVGPGSTNGVDPRFFGPAFETPEQRSEFLRSVDLAEDDRVLLFLGRVVKDKGVEELVEAFEGVCQRHPQALLLLVGHLEQDLDPITTGTLERIHHHPRIRALPWTEDVHELLDAATVLVHPSHREGLPNVLLQAAAAGCPIVCSDISANLEVVGHDGAETFPVADATALSRCLDTVLSDPTRIHDRTGQLRRTVQRRFDRAVVQAQVIEVYRAELATTNASPSAKT